MSKVAVLLRRPDSVTLHYGEDRIIVATWADFHENVFYVEEEDMVKLEPYLAETETGRLDS